MKITIINPLAPKGDVIKGRLRQPLCLAGIASILRNKGHEIKLIDMNAMEMETSPVVHETEYLIITSSPMDRWETPYLDLTNAYKVIKTYKDIGAKIILTGPHGTLTPDEIFSKSKDIDIILRGETEETVSELFEHLDDLKNRTQRR